MANLGQAYVQIVPQAKGISKSIGGLLDPGAKSAGEKAGKQSGAGLAAGLKGTIAKLAIGATIGAGIKKALDEGGKLQQSFGGLETLFGNVTESAAAMGISVKEYTEQFGDASDKMKTYAMQAYKIGVSANDYAEQAVSFGASLKQAFSGDATAAAEAANVAIMDMADNAAKMGTPLENIQNAYQGFAKQNYTMLDNLKLGYGGTKEEMARLLADAQAITGVEYDMSNLGDVYAAIHVIQGELGLTGVAAAEASETFSGSLGAMQAAATNLFATLTTGGDIETAMSNLLATAGTFIFGNLLPMLGSLATSLPGALRTAFETAVPQIAEKAPELINTLKEKLTTNAPKLLNSGLELVRKIADGLIQNLPTIHAKAQELVLNLASKILEYAPTIFEKGKELIVNLINGIGDAIPVLLENGTTMLEKFVSILQANLPKLATAGGEMLGAIAGAIIANIPKIITAVYKIIPRLWTAFWKLVDLAGKSATKMLDAMAAGIRNGISAVMPAVKSLITKITKPISDLKGKIKDIMGQVANKMYDTWTNIKTKATTLWNSIKTAITSPIEKAKETVSGAVTKIKSIFPISMGKIFSGIKLPHFKISGGTVPWGIGGQGTKPSVGIEWYKRGGIATEPVIYGIGEKGNEAIVPLSEPYMRPFADAIADRLNNSSTNNFYITVSGKESPAEFADKLVRELQLRVRTA